MKKITLMLLFINTLIYTQSQTIESKYTYPIARGTQEWANLKTIQEKRSACEIPANIIKSLSTRALAETCMDYPFWYSILLNNSIPNGVQFLIDNFNGLNELSKRLDGATELLKIYNSYVVMRPTLIQNEKARAYNSYKFIYIEYLFGNPSFLSKLSKDEKTALRQEGISKYDQKKNLISDFGGFNLKSSAYLLGSLITSENKQSLLGKSEANVKYFLYNGILVSQGIIDTIYTVTKKF